MTLWRTFWWWTKVPWVRMDSAPVKGEQESLTDVSLQHPEEVESLLGLFQLNNLKSVAFCTLSPLMESRDTTTCFLKNVKLFFCTGNCVLVCENLWIHLNFSMFFPEHSNSQLVIYECMLSASLLTFWVSPACYFLIMGPQPLKHDMVHDKTLWVKVPVRDRSKT